MDYGNLLARAWKITWTNKSLWLLGFLAGLGSGFNFRGNTGGGGSGSGGGQGPDILPPEVQSYVERPEVVGIVITIVCILLVIAVVFFILSIIARGGLVGGIRIADDTGQVTLRESWNIGVRYFWRTLGITLVTLIPVIIFVVLTAGIVLLTFGLGGLCVLPLLCVFVIVMIPLSIVVWLGQIGIVVDDLSVMDALRKGWAMLKANVANILITGLILIVISFVVGLVMLLPMAVIAIPAVFAFIADPQQPNVPLLAGAGLGLLCLLPFLWTASGILNTWVYSVWTLAYRHFSGSSVVATPAVVQPA
jgi:hypothetical protein